MNSSVYWSATAAAATAATYVRSDDDWDAHRFGLCRKCNRGLDDESEFVDIGDDSNTVLVCIDCVVGVPQGVPPPYDGLYIC